MKDRKFDYRRFSILLLILVFLISISLLIYYSDGSETDDVGVAFTIQCQTTNSPVCGSDNVTYDNACEAGKASADSLCSGTCPCNNDSIVSGARLSPSSGFFEIISAQTFDLVVSPSLTNANSAIISMSLENMVIQELRVEDGVQVIGTCSSSNRNIYYRNGNELCLDISKETAFTQNEKIAEIDILFGNSYQAKAVKLQNFAYSEGDTLQVDQGLAGLYGLYSTQVTGTGTISQTTGNTTVQTTGNTTIDNPTTTGADAIDGNVDSNTTSQTTGNTTSQTTGNTTSETTGNTTSQTTGETTGNSTGNTDGGEVIIVNPSGDIICGFIDIGNDGKLSLPDFIDFARNYTKSCRDKYPTTGCGGKDVDRDGFINFRDFIGLAQNYGVQRNCLNLPNLYQ